jgi:hypothetical protein
MERFLEFLVTIFTEPVKDMSEEDWNKAELLAKYVLQCTQTAMEKGQDKDSQPIMNLSVWVKPMTGGVDIFSYRISTIGGEPFMIFNLGELAKQLDKAVGKWGTISWGDLTKMDTSGFEQWGHLDTSR